MTDRPSDPSTVLGDGLGDWRFRFIEKIQTGDRVRVASVLGQLQAPSGETFDFADFMAVALYLNVAMTADAKANELRGLWSCPPSVDTRSLGPMPMRRCSHAPYQAGLSAGVQGRGGSPRGER